MEDQILKLFPDQVVQLQDYHSFVNQPERIQITSQEDVSDYDPNTVTSYFSFRVRLPRPALNVKTLQLARASIPYAVPNIPDSETVFWYYALPPVSPGTIRVNNGGAPGAVVLNFDSLGNCYDLNGDLSGVAKVYFDSGNFQGTFTYTTHTYLYNALTARPGNVATACIEAGSTNYWITYTDPQVGRPNDAFLRYIRLLPSFVQPELLNNFTGGFNRTFQDYGDLVTELNAASTDDPMEGEAGNEILGEFQFVPNDVGFAYNQTFNKIVMRGLTTTNNFYVYMPAAADDPIWAAAALELQRRDRLSGRFNIQGAIAPINPFAPFRNLNQRLGFCYVVYPDNIIDYNNMQRPIQPYIANPPLNLGAFTVWDHVAPGYCDLNYSSCAYIYADITGGSTVDSLVNRALLGTVPINAANLGVGFHSLPLNNPLTKVANQLYEINVELRTDTGQPFYLPNSAIVSLELVLTY